VKILWDSGNVGFGGCGINEWDRNVISELRRQGHDVTLLVDDLLARRPKFKKWEAPEGGYDRVKEKITASNYAEVVNRFGPFDVQIGNQFTMFPVLENIVPVCHDYDIPGRKEYSLGIKMSTHGLSRITQKFACTTPFIQQQIDTVLPNVQTVCLYGGSKFVPISVEKPEKEYIAYWGNRYSKEKNFLALLNTLPYHDLDMVVCSFSPPKPEELKLVENLGATGRVTFCVGLTDSELNKIVAGASLYVCPSTYEGFGLPVVEAMAVGIPVIVAPCAALPSVGGDAVLMAKSHKTKDLVAGIREVFENYNETRRRVELGLVQVSNWTWANAASTLISFCEQS
jgi:glycosyltransferase involved in cell wall biosynthesis